MFKIFTRNLIRPLLILFLLLFEGISFSLMAQQTLSPGVDSVVVTFKNIPTQFSVEKAPLKYNKAFAMSFQEDDALSDIYNLVYCKHVSILVRQTYNNRQLQRVWL